MSMPWCTVAVEMMETPQSRPWKDGDDIYGIVLSCSTGSESRGVRQFLRSNYDMVSLGSQSNSNVRDPTMAAMHAVLYLRKNEVRVRVIDNASGVIKNGQRVYGEGKVNDGDELRFGSFMVKIMMIRPEIGVDVAGDTDPESERFDPPDQPSVAGGSLLPRGALKRDSESGEDDIETLEDEALRLLARISIGELMVERLRLMRSEYPEILSGVIDDLQGKARDNRLEDVEKLEDIMFSLKEKKDQQ